MILGYKTIFGRACGTSSKNCFSDLPLNASYVPNKPFFFKVVKIIPKPSSANLELLRYV
jgi:hypothetical protein